MTTIDVMSEDLKNLLEFTVLGLFFSSLVPFRILGVIPGHRHWANCLGTSENQWKDLRAHLVLIFIREVISLKNYANWNLVYVKFVKNFDDFVEFILKNGVTSKRQPSATIENCNKIE